MTPMNKSMKHRATRGFRAHLAVLGIVFSLGVPLYGQAMPNHKLNLSLQPERLTICRLAPEAAIPEWASGHAAFLSITRTRDELSIVCEAKRVPAAVKQEGGWRVLKVAGPLDFSLIGILASLTEPLAKASISIMAISTFDTDYLMVKEAKLEEAIKVLKAAGHRIKVE